MSGRLTSSMHGKWYIGQVVELLRGQTRIGTSVVKKLTVDGRRVVLETGDAYNSGFGDHSGTRSRTQNGLRIRPLT